jgi:hypothetical protein
LEPKIEQEYTQNMQSAKDQTCQQHSRSKFLFVNIDELEEQIKQQPVFLLNENPFL